MRRRALAIGALAATCTACGTSAPSATRPTTRSASFGTSWTMLSFRSSQPRPAGKPAQTTWVTVGFVADAGDHLLRLESVVWADQRHQVPLESTSYDVHRAGLRRTSYDTCKVDTVSELPSAATGAAVIADAIGPLQLASNGEARVDDGETTMTVRQRPASSLASRVVTVTYDGDHSVVARIDRVSLTHASAGPAVPQCRQQH